MTPEQQRETIANACGYVQLPNGYWRGPTMTVGSCGIPNYLGCLNAMHEAWKKLTQQQKIRYRLELAMIAVRESRMRDDCYYEDIAAEFGPEAFLRTIGRWES